MATPSTLPAWLSLLEQRHPSTIDLGLERVGSVYRKLGSPRPGRHVITVAGTNGKGSTVAWLNALGAAAGLRTATYTSPHLFRFTERLLVDGRELPESAWVEALNRVEQARGDTGLSYFEQTTLAAFCLMAESNMAQEAVELALLEVGLGGRLDAVNLVDAEVSVITPIALDHQEYLGSDRDAVAREKAGILRPGGRAVIGDPDPPEALAIALTEQHCRYRLLGRDFDCDPAKGILHSPEQDWPVGNLALSGAHQYANLATAVAAFGWLFPRHLAAIDMMAVTRQVHLPGRLQRLNPAPELVVDVGHNPHAAHHLANWLRQHPVAGSTHLLLAMLADKDAVRVARVLDPVLDPGVDRWLLAGLPGARGQSGADLAATLAPLLNREPAAADMASVAQVFDTVEQALEGVWSDLGDDDRLVVFGSFHTVAAASDWWQRQGRLEAAGQPPGTTGT